MPTHTGTKINNDTMFGMTDNWAYDYRWYIPTKSAISEQVTTYSLDREEFQRNLEHTRHRLALWFGSVHNCPHEVCKIPTTDEFVDLEVGPPPIVEEKQSEPHIYVDELSVLFGGWATNESQESLRRNKLIDDVSQLTDQISHVDTKDIEVQGRLCGVSHNPLLRGKCKPHSACIPLLDFREMYFQEGPRRKVNVRARVGEAILFGGDTVHGEKTYHAAEQGVDFSMHVSLHVYFKSLHHPVGDAYSHIDDESLAYLSPQLLPSLPVSVQEHAVTPMVEDTTTALKCCMTNKGDTERIQKVVKSTIVELGGTLPADSLEEIIGQLKTLLYRVATLQRVQPMVMMRQQKGPHSIQSPER
jgi:hypothetical protein